MMGGTITFESDYGTGSVFNIIIPIEEGDESKVSRESASQKTQAISAPDALVLVVDDNEFNLKVAEGLLELFKVKAVLASSGQEALEMIKNANFDIIFMDHMMPDMDGLETTAEIRVWEKGRRKGSSSSQKRIPVIALTANAVQGSREMFLEHDMDDFLSKPIEIPILARILSDWLPPEKITIKHETDTTSAKDESISKEDSTSLETVNTISEINLETGLGRVNGRKDMYLNNLKLFKERIAPDNKKMTDLLNSSDIKNFSITVHAIKSALASIGAEQLSNIALALENSSKEGNAEYCKQNFPSFSERLTELDEELSKAFSPADKKAKAGKTFTSEKEAIAYLKENLQKALDAIDDFDNDEGIDALNNLLACKYDNEIKELLEKAVAELKRFKYKEAKDILAQL
jgi:CheY-like chemotaxis protein